MAQPPIIRRTEKLHALTGLLKQRQAVYIACFFYSGKTVLLDQLCASWGGDVLRFNPERDDWDQFKAGLAGPGEGLIVIDGVDRFSGPMLEDLAALLAALPEGRYAAVAGRAQLPAVLRKLCFGGSVAVLGWDFVMFDKEEVIQLFLEYGIELLPSDIRLILDGLWGWVFSLHMLARRLQENPNVPMRAQIDATRVEIKRLLISDVVLAFPEQERQLMYDLSPFERFSGEMARIVTGRNDAPRMIEEIAQKSHMLQWEGEGRYTFIPIVRQALFAEMRNLYSRDYINGQYKRAALYFELENRIPQAISYYRQMGDVEKIRELLIRDTFNRPADGDYVDLREDYALLKEETILAYPELMKGKCVIECLLGHAEESDRWYDALCDFIRRIPARDARRRTAEEAKAYLDLCLSHRGSRHTLKRLVAAAKSPGLRQSATWNAGFNISGNSVSLLNGGLDFCRWVPHGWSLYRLFKAPVELALGQGGSGVADIAIAERELEANPEGDYSTAMAKVLQGMQRAADGTEMHYAAIGIQSRIEAARGNVDEALSMIDNAIASLREDHPMRLAQNLEAFRQGLLLLRGDVDEARSWLESGVPDETGVFVIMDRYRYMLKLRLYIILSRRSRVPYLTALLRQYFERYDRPYMLVQLDLLEAVYHYRGGSEAWRACMSRALALAKRYGLIRVVADEGIAIIDMLNALSLPDEPWERSVLALTRRQAAYYPNYMKPAANRPVFTDREYQVYSLMIAGYRNAKIASVLNITERTVKYFCGIIYRKLGVTTRAEALNRAAELGDIK